MPLYTQDAHLISVKTPLGKDALYLKSFRGEESVSQLFHFSLDLLSDESEIDPKKIVGKSVTVSIRFPDETERFFNGIVNRFAYAGTGDRFSGYRAEVVPELWLLTRTADCKIFQDEAIPDILKDVFESAGFVNFDLGKLTGSYQPREYCVQYRETDFSFVSRLMEQYGIYYFFKHEDGKHTMVLADSVSAYEECDEDEVTLRRNIAGHDDLLTQWQHQFEFCPGKYVHTDYNFEKPKANLQNSSETTVDLDKVKDYEIFDYPGQYAEMAEGDALVQQRMEQLEVAHDVVSGSSICRSFHPGGTFKVKEHISKAESGKSYVITSVVHSAAIDELSSDYTAKEFNFSNRFQCVPDNVVLRPARTTSKPVIQGVQTARVVGPEGEEIWPDEYGRVKVQFFWDRYGQDDDKSSCWIRCMQGSAGRGWGSMLIPRIGQEVVVTYVEGDPDRPLIVGQVYNSDQMPAYTLPDEKTKSYVKSNSSTGGDGFNEIRFEDKRDEEQVFVHAERNMDTRVKGDRFERVLGNQHEIIGADQDGGDQRILIHQDQHVSIKRNCVEHIGGNFQLMIGYGDGGGGKLDVVIEQQESRKIGPDGLHVTVEGDSNHKVDGSVSETTAGDHNQVVTGNYAVETSTGDIHIKGGMNVVVEAAMQLTLKVGGNFVSITPMGVDIFGTLVNINSGGSAGSGPGASPASPQEPQEAAPTEPDEADDSTTGQVSCD